MQSSTNLIVILGRVVRYGEVKVYTDILRDFPTFLSLFVFLIVFLHVPHIEKRHLLVHLGFFSLFSPPI